MVSAYHKWKYLAPDSMDTSDDGAYDFTIEVLDIFTLAKSALIKRTADQTTAEALCLNGYIGSTPEHPTLALSLRTLDLFHRIRLRKASFSIEAFTKVLCDLYNVSFF